MPTDEIRLLRTLKTDPRFIRSWRILVDEQISFQQFEQLPMPDGVTPQELWSFFAVQRKEAGFLMKSRPDTRADGDVQWAFFPRQCQKIIRKIISISAENSSLNDYVAQHGRNDSGLLPFTIEEVASLADRDGIPLEQEAIRELWTGARGPLTPGEHIICNMHQILDNLSPYLERNLSLTLVDDLHERMVEGVSGLHPRRRFLHETSLIDYSQDRRTDREFARERIRDELSDSPRSEDYMHPIIESIMLSTVFLNNTPYQDFNALTDLLVRKVFFIKQGLDVISYVPYSNMLDHLRGSDDFLQEAALKYKTLDENELASGGLDISVFLIGSCALYLKGLQRIDDAVGELVELDERSRERLSGIENLNLRQKEFLVLVSRNTSKTYKLADYMDAFKVVYATARSDMLDLVDKGYLMYRKSGRAFVFSAVPGMVR